MTAIATRSGRVIDFLAPDPGQIHLQDIADGLSKAPRYAGQTEKVWTVIQHSLLVAQMVGPEHRLHALLHDAPEAYLCDVPSPAKDAMRVISNDDIGEGGCLFIRPSAYDVIEFRLWSAICSRWDLSPEMPAPVKTADELVMAIEAPELQPEGWEHPVWDFAREIVVLRHEVEQFHQLLMEGPHLAVGRWLVAVADELRARKVAA